MSGALWEKTVTTNGPCLILGLDFKPCHVTGLFPYVVGGEGKEKIDMAISEIGWSWRLLCHSHMYRVNVNSPNPNTPLFLQIPKPIRFTKTSTGWSSCVVARALDPKTEDQKSTSSSQEDLVYVGKLVTGSFVGAGAIKYGSAVFPEITTPNLVLALTIIFTPVIVAAFLLIKESRTNP